MPRRALFVVLEGMEGTGKTTQVEALKDHYSSKDLLVFATREPGGTQLGNEVRVLLLQSRNEKLTPWSELFLLEAARAQHVEHVLRPQLENVDLLICDRYTDATLAYQGGGRGIDLKLLTHLNEIATGGLHPDLTILLDSPTDLSLKRAWARISAQKKGTAEDRFEREDISFHERVREAYLQLARDDPGRFLVVDASQPAPKITPTLIQKIDGLRCL